MTEEALKNIYLKDFHKKNDAKFLPFAGYDMPINYKQGIINEHIYVRNHTGVFDVSHMGQILIPFSENNIAALESYIPLNIKKIISNKCHYSFILNSNAGIVDDIMLSKIKFANNEFVYIVYNSSRKQILNEIFNATISNFKIFEDRCLIAIQGPESFSTISSILNLPASLNFLNIQILQHYDSDLFVSRSGYTGEDGFEISILNNKAEKLINDILNTNNAILCGLGCRDSLRVEAGLSLYGNEINEDINPIQAGLSWALDKNRLQDNNLNGSEILSKELSSIPLVKKIGLSPINKIMLRNKMAIHNKNKEEIGFITSGCYSPILKKSIGIGYINKLSNISDKKYVNVRDKYEEIKLEKIPFVKKNYKKGD
ncbi:glycine cleavage system aminomethyltransferase GcvT [Pelagibacteraceae bacterium]|nr:glycine cleavage system aminomethyltransferase GcvT [Pelagibacteraceae bacterium]